MQRQPTLLNSCARAATAAEARYRISYPFGTTRASRIIALDERAASVVQGLAGQQWSGGHFLVFERALPTNGSGDAAADAVLRTTDGARVTLGEELDGADVAVVVATSDVRPEAASVIGNACAARLIMTAGFVLSGDGGVDEAVCVLRPNVMVLMVLRDHEDIPAILGALRV
jgi:hypothetical protein